MHICFKTMNIITENDKRSIFYSIRKNTFFVPLKTRNLVEKLYLMRIKCTVRIHHFGMLHLKTVHLKIYTSMLAIFGIVHSKIADLVNIKLFLTIVV